MLRQISIGMVILTLVGSCCPPTCDCFNDFASSISIQFNLDSNSVSGFKRKELLGTTFLQYRKDQPIPDTLGTIDSLDLLPMYGNAAIGFWIRNSIDKKVYENPDSFRLFNANQLIDVSFTEIETQGNIPTALCCNCYSNESISYKANGVFYSQKGEAKSGVKYTVNKP